MSWPQPAHAAIAELLARHAGLAFSGAGQAESAGAAFERAMRRAGAKGADDYLERLRRDPDALEDLLAEVTVGETYFFREPGHFEFIREEVLPDWPALRAWSAGCATGEEAYSLAMLFESAGLPGGWVLATDLSRPALERARRGVYTAWSLRGEGADLARPYLETQGKHFVVRELIRRRVHFARLNLADEGGYPSPDNGTAGLGLILCRNVLIYFDRRVVESVARRLFACLLPGGWLVTASSDPPLGGLAPFEARVTPRGVFYRRPAPWRVWGGGAMQEEVGADAKRQAAEAAAAEETEPPAADPAADVRGLANRDLPGAERACAEACRRTPLSRELHHLHALLLVALGRDAEAVAALRRVLCLDRSLAVAHFTLASLLERQGRPDAACRSYRRARALAGALGPAEALPLGDGGTAGALAAAAADRLAALAPTTEEQP